MIIFFYLVYGEVGVGGVIFFDVMFCFEIELFEVKFWKYLDFDNDVLKVRFVVGVIVIDICWFDEWKLIGVILGSFLVIFFDVIGNLNLNFG